MKQLYRSFNIFLREKFNGERVRKIPLNAGFPCPNKNGDISDKGCIFCDEYSSGPLKSFNMSLKDQIEIVLKRDSTSKYIAYFQANSNTYGPVDELREKYLSVLEYEQIVSLFIGTRPDCIDERIIPVLKELNEKIYLTVELGLQTIHEKGLAFLRRNHTYKQFLDAFSLIKEAGIDQVVHLIVGVPGETLDDMKNTVLEMNRIKPKGIKFHLLHVLKNTDLADLYRKGQIPLMEREEYISTIVDLLEILDPEIVIHRLTGERDRELFIAPEWTMDKSRVIEDIRKEFKRRNSFQGSRFSG